MYLLNPLSTLVEPGAIGSPCIFFINEFSKNVFMKEMPVNSESAFTLSLKRSVTSTKKIKFSELKQYGNIKSLQLVSRTVKQRLVILFEINLNL